MLDRREEKWPKVKGLIHFDEWIYPFVLLPSSSTPPVFVDDVSGERERGRYKHTRRREMCLKQWENSEFYRSCCSLWSLPFGLFSWSSPSISHLMRLTWNGREDIEGEKERKGMLCHHFSLLRVRREKRSLRKIKASSRDTFLSFPRCK